MAVSDFEASIENVFRGVRGGSVSLDQAESRLKAEIDQYRLMLFDDLGTWLQSPRPLDGFVPSHGGLWEGDAHEAATRVKNEARHRLGVALLGKHYKPGKQ